jgi:hypothetical protein
MKGKNIAKKVTSWAIKDTDIVNPKVDSEQISNEAAEQTEGGRVGVDFGCVPVTGCAGNTGCNKPSVIE